jgi:hypothetical protein
MAGGRPYNVRASDLRALNLYYDQLRGDSIATLVDRYSMSEGGVNGALARARAMGVGDVELEVRRNTLRARLLSDLEDADHEYARYRRSQLLIDRETKRLQAEIKEGPPRDSVEEWSSRDENMWHRIRNETIGSLEFNRTRLVPLMRASNDQKNTCLERIRELDGLKSVTVDAGGDAQLPHVTITFNGSSNPPQTTDED